MHKQEQFMIYNPAVEQIVRAFVIGRPHDPQPLDDVPLLVRPLEPCFVGFYDVGFGAKPDAAQVSACAYYGVRAQDILDRLLQMQTKDDNEPVCFLLNPEKIVSGIGTEVGAVYAAVYHLLYKKGKRKVRAH